MTGQRTLLAVAIPFYEEFHYGRVTGFAKSLRSVECLTGGPGKVPEDLPLRLGLCFQHQLPGFQLERDILQRKGLGINQSNFGGLRLLTDKICFQKPTAVKRLLAMDCEGLFWKFGGRET